MLLDWKPCSISCSLYIFASVSTRWRCYWIGNLNIKPVQNDLNEIVFASPLAGDVIGLETSRRPCGLSAPALNAWSPLAGDVIGLETI
jgi:hypothetical protein